MGSAAWLVAFSYDGRQAAPMSIRPTCFLVHIPVRCAPSLLGASSSFWIFSWRERLAAHCVGACAATPGASHSSRHHTSHRSVISLRGFSPDPTSPAAGYLPALAAVNTSTTKFQTSHRANHWADVGMGDTMIVLSMMPRLKVQVDNCWLLIAGNDMITTLACVCLQASGPCLPGNYAAHGTTPREFRAPGHTSICP